MVIIIKVLLIIGALFGLWYTSEELELADFEETKAWLKTKFGKDNTNKEFRKNFRDVMFDWDCEMIIKHLIFIVCEGIILYTIIDSIICWNCFSILRLFISIVGIINTILIFFTFDSEKIELIDYEFQSYGASMIAYAWGLIITLYTLLFYFRAYFITNILWIIPVFLIQYICWRLFFFILNLRNKDNF